MKATKNPPGTIGGWAAGGGLNGRIDRTSGLTRGFPSSLSARHDRRPATASVGGCADRSVHGRHHDAKHSAVNQAGAKMPPWALRLGPASATALFGPA